jgi:DNA-binding IclR family transcriptional regulator
VLVCVARETNFRLRDIAACVGITERAAHRIVSDLCEAGYLTRHRLGNRNYYEVDPTLPMRHPYEQGFQVGEILGPLLRRDTRAS